MRLAMIHDAKFAIENGKIYCSRTDHTFMKYLLRHYDSIEVVLRNGEKRKDFISAEDLNIKAETVNPITSPSGFIKSFFKTRKTIKNAIERCDHVYCRGINGVIAQRIAQKNGIPQITYVGGSVYETLINMKSPFKRFVAGSIEHFIKKCIYRSSYVIFCSKYLDRIYKTKGKSIVWVEIILNKFSKEIYENRLKRINNCGEKVNLGLIGYVHNSIKGIDTAINALALLDSKYVLKVLGNGDPSCWKQLTDSLGVTKRVEFCGSLPTSGDVLLWLDDIDVYIQPSLTEGLCKATIEAMSRGCPVITSDAGALPDLSSEEYRHRVGDFKKLTELILRLEDKNEMIKSCEYSFQKVRNEFDTDILDKKFDEFFLEITGAQHE